MDSLPVEFAPLVVDWRLQEAELLSEASGSKVLPRLPIIDIPTAFSDTGLLHGHILGCSFLVKLTTINHKISVRFRNNMR